MLEGLVFSRALQAEGGLSVAIGGSPVFESAVRGRAQSVSAVTHSDSAANSYEASEKKPLKQRDTRLKQELLVGSEGL